MSGELRISVVVPAYNAEGTIRDAIASIDVQGVSDLEVIIVDDVSADATCDILDAESAGRENLTIIKRGANGGPAAARNDGISKARGEWIAFLDGDDAWLPGKLQAQLQLADAHPDVDLWCGGVKQVSGRGKWVSEIGIRDSTEIENLDSEETSPDDTESRISKLSNQQIPFREIPLEEFVNCNSVATSTVLVKREALERVGGFDTQFVGPEDYDLWMRLAVDHRLARIDAPLSRYRHVVGSLSMDERKFLPQVLRVLEKGFAEGGALHGFAHLRKAAISNQLWNASWMAFNRGARLSAIRYWAQSWAMNLQAERREPRKWARLLFRYICGRRVQ